jgi:hypothetical protein
VRQRQPIVITREQPAVAIQELDTDRDVAHT